MWYLVIPLLLFTLISLVFLFRKIIETNAISVERRIVQLLDMHAERDHYYAIHHSLGFIEVPAPANRGTGHSTSVPKSSEKIALHKEKKPKVVSPIHPSKSLNLLQSVLEKNQRPSLNENVTLEKLDKVAQKIQKKEKKKRERKDIESKNKTRNKEKKEVKQPLAQPVPDKKEPTIHTEEEANVVKVEKSKKEVKAVELKDTKSDTKPIDVKPLQVASELPGSDKPKSKSEVSKPKEQGDMKPVETKPGKEEPLKTKPIEVPKVASPAVQSTVAVETELNLKEFKSVDMSEEKLLSPEKPKPIDSPHPPPIDATRTQSDLPTKPLHSEPSIELHAVSTMDSPDMSPLAFSPSLLDALGEPSSLSSSKEPRQTLNGKRLFDTERPSTATESSSGIFSHLNGGEKLAENEMGTRKRRASSAFSRKNNSASRSNTPARMKPLPHRKPQSRSTSRQMSANAAEFHLDSPACTSVQSSQGINEGSINGEEDSFYPRLNQVEYPSNRGMLQNPVLLNGSRSPWLDPLYPRYESQLRGYDYSGFGYDDMSFFSSYPYRDINRAQPSMAPIDGYSHYTDYYPMNYRTGGLGMNRPPNLGSHGYGGDSLLSSGLLGNPRSSYYGYRMDNPLDDPRLMETLLSEENERIADDYEDVPLTLPDPENIVFPSSRSPPVSHSFSHMGDGLGSLPSDTSHFGGYGLGRDSSNGFYPMNQYQRPPRNDPNQQYYNIC